jgi:hypothetical protein
LDRNFCQKPETLHTREARETLRTREGWILLLLCDGLARDFRVSRISGESVVMILWSPRPAANGSSGTDNLPESTLRLDSVPPLRRTRNALSKVAHRRFS